MLNPTNSSHVAKTAKDNNAQQFSELMMRGRVEDALHLLSEDNYGGPLPMTSSVLSVKYTKKQEPVPSTMVGNSSVPISAPHPIAFDRLDAICIHQAALKLVVLLVPLVLMLQPGTIYAPCFSEHPVCNVLSAGARILYTTSVGLPAFVSCDLIALDKCPGV